jgi:hypothetical protein
MTDDIYVGAIGVEFRPDVGTSLSSTTKMEIWAKKPSGAIVHWTALQYGSTTKLTYKTVSGDLDESGTWTFMGYVEWSSTDHHWGIAYEKEVLELFTVPES